MLNVTIEVFGWIAAVLMLSAYVLLNTGRVSASSPLYQWLNVISGMGFFVNSGWNGAYPSAAINVVWMFIGIFGLLRAANPRAPVGL